ncbi:MAG TPA: hypothetical protein VII98_02820 [Solirubrobacteraceae bacterium]
MLREGRRPGRTTHRSVDLVVVKVRAIDATWSGLKLVIRRELG